MSGGYFDYIQYRFDEPIEMLEDYLKTNESGFNEKTLLCFQNTIAYLKMSKIYLHRADWLLSGDDGEETYHERLKEEMLTLSRQLRGLE
jgi:hypothetical protein